MSWARFRERLGLALSPGGVAATAWWISNKVLRTEAYQLLACRYSTQPTGEIPPSRFLFHFVSQPEEASGLPESVLTQLESQTRQGIADLARQGSSVYFLASGSSVACQLLVVRGPDIRVDVPAGLRLGVGNDGAFVSYVYTHAAFRRMGAARELLLRVGKDLGRRGIGFAVAHVSVTNVPSLQTFARAGWKSVGMMAFTRGGRLLFASQSGDRRLTIRYESRRARAQRIAS